MGRMTKFTLIGAAAVFFSSLAMCALIILSDRALSLASAVVASCVLSLALTGAALLLWRKAIGRFHQSASSLPDGLADQIRPLPPDEQFALVCQRCKDQGDERAWKDRNHFITQLLNKESPVHIQASEDIGSDLSNILHDTMHFDNASFCLVYVCVEDYEAYLLRVCDGQLVSKNIRQMYATVHRFFSQALNARHTAYSVEWSNGLVFLVNLAGTTAKTTREEEEALIDQICDDCDATVRKIASSFGIDVEVAVSGPYRDIRETSITFSWTETLKEYDNFVHGPRPVLGPNMMDQLSEISPSHKYSLEKNYCSAVLAENFSQAEQDLYELESHALNDPSYSISLLKRTVYNCLNTAESIVSSNTIEASFEPVSSINWRERLDSSKTLADLNDVIHDFFDFLICRSSARQNEITTTAQEIRTILDSRFTDPQLTVTTLSDKFHLSASYISRIFKKEFGLSVPNYIHEKRIELAKELLVSTDLSINEIALQVGYSTSWTMNRIFNSRLQMTPGAWRSKHKA